MQCLPLMKPISTLCVVYSKKEYSFCTMNIDEQHVFVKYYDSIREEAVLVDKKVKCIRLKWDPYGDFEH